MTHKPTIITVANQKGGVGKTTTVANIAAAFADKGSKVLVIDCDYQSNLSSLFGGDEQLQDKTHTLTYAIKNDLNFTKVIVPTPFKNLSLIPSSRELDELREQLVGQPNQFKLIDFLLDCPAKTQYDFVIIDTHPSLDCFFQSAIAASHHYIIPLFPEADSSRGLAHQVQAVEKVKRYLNPSLNFLGCAIVKYDRYNATHQKFEKLIRQFAKENNIEVFPTNIPNSQSVAAAAAHGLPLFYYKNDSPAAKAYRKLAKEIIKAAGLTKTSKKTGVVTQVNKFNDLEVAVDL